MSKTLNNLKQSIYYSATILFPSFYKKRFFSNLNQAFSDSKNCGLLPEKELLVLYYLLKENHVAVDVGANNGAYSYFFKEIKKAKTVYAFEPLPNLYKKLTIWFKNIELFNLALSSKKEAAKIHIPIINDKLYESRAKLDDLKEVNETGFKEIEISIDTLDHILESKKPNQLDIIKIDIEGHELKAIEGARKTIHTFKPYLLVEIESRHHNQSIAEPVNFICSLNYEAYFFNFKSKSLEPFSHYNMAEMQDAKNQNTFNYINNFLFVPLEKIGEVAKVNQQILNYFNKN
jgi:FkbM family methyltransferase